MRLKTKIAVALLALGLAASASAQVGDDEPTPPLLPGEEYVLTQNGCGIVVVLPPGPNAEQLRTYYGAMAWSGECRHGLIHGQGSNGVDRYVREALHGRLLPRATSETQVYTLPNGSVVSMRNLPNPFDGGWGETTVRVTGYLRSPSDYLNVTTAPRGPNEPFGFNISGPGVSQAVDCPLNRDRAEAVRQCQALYESTNAATFQIIRSIVAEAEAHDARMRAELPALNAQWDANYPQMVAERPVRLAARNQSALSSFGAGLARLQQEDSRASQERASAAARAEAEERRLGPAQYSSVCMRDFQAIQDVVTRERAENVAGIDNLWVPTFNDEGAELMERCPSDPAAAEQARRARNEAQRVRNKCASGNHHRGECLQWGDETVATNGVTVSANNQNFYRVWRREWERAMNDPNYSASLGRAAGGGYVLTDNNAHQCMVRMQDLGRDMRAADARIPADDVVHRAELIMWYTQEARAYILATCPNAPSYAQEAQSFQSTFANTQRTCNQITSSASGCVARLPN